MIRTKEQLIKHLIKIGNMKIEQGVYFKELAYSIRHYKEQRSLKEWLKLVNFKIEEEGGKENDN